MEKFIQFTEEQKSLVWRTKVQPQGGTADDARIFMEVCEQYGLNPLLGDIIFQRYETKRGPVVNFIVSRDGYLKAAMRDKNFIKCVSAVIKEGDDFEMDIDGNVKHKFGAKRGKIIGAWAYAEHASRGKLPVIVDFQEYFTANAQSQNGRSPIWDSMPSAMIQKVAEVAALRRQFPLGGIVTEEEMGFVNMDADLQEPVQPTQPVKVPAETTKDAKNKNKQEKKTSSAKTKTEAKAEKVEQPVEKLTDKVENAQAPIELPETKPVDTPVETPADKTPEIATTEKDLKTKEVVVQEDAKVETGADEETEHSFKEWTVLGVKDGKTPNGKPFLKVAVENKNGEKLIALAREEKVMNMLDEVVDHQTYLMDIQNINGYDFLMALGQLVSVA